jgi:hypothetical protein
MMKLVLRFFLILVLMLLISSGAGAQGSRQPADVNQTYLPLILTPAYAYVPLVTNQQTNAWIGPDGGSVVKLVIDPLGPDILYAGTWGSGVFRSLDGGATWQMASVGLANTSVTALVIPQGEGEQLYVATNGRTIPLQPVKSTTLANQPKTILW